MDIFEELGKVISEEQIMEIRKATAIQIEAIAKLKEKGFFEHIKGVETCAIVNHGNCEDSTNIQLEIDLPFSPPMVEERSQLEQRFEYMLKFAFCMELLTAKFAGIDISELEEKLQKTL
jgi:hypothetical protein